MLRGSPAQPRKWRKRLLLYAAVLALLSLYWPQAQIALRLNRNTAETQRSATAARSSNRSGGYEVRTQTDTPQQTSDTAPRWPRARRPPAPWARAPPAWGLRASRPLDADDRGGRGGVAAADQGAW
jgi:cytoskeletal protein RodZ